MNTIDFTTSPYQDYGVDAITNIEPAPQIQPEITPVVPAENEAVPCDLSKYYFYVTDMRQHYPMDGENLNDLLIDFDVNVTCGNKSVKLTKRLKLCKHTLAQECDMKDAMLNMTATVVEQKQEEPYKKSSTQRMLELAGIRNNKNYV